MIGPRRPALASFALLTCLAALPAGAQPTPAAPPKGSPEQVQTISDLRNVGTAMFVWYRDQLKARPKKEAAHHEEADVKSADLAAIPVIPREELAKLLVPKYLQAIPEKDGWGHPYEYHLNTADLTARSIMGLRSAGRDGRFSGDSYEIGAFAAADEDQDLVWVDGYFARWPQPPAYP